MDSGATVSTRAPARCGSASSAPNPGPTRCARRSNRRSAWTPPISMDSPDVESVLGLDAFLRYAWADHLGESIDIGGVHAERLFDLLAHRVGPGFGAEDAEPQRAGARVDTVAPESIQDRQHVTGRDHDHVGPEVGNELYLPLGHAAGHRHDGASEAFSAVVGTEAACEQTVPVRHVNHHAGPSARGANRAGHDSGPHLNVSPGIADDDWLPRRTRRSVDPGNLFSRDGEEAERIIVAEVLLHRERELRQVPQIVQIGWVNARRIEGAAVVWHVLVRVVQRPGEPCPLQGLYLVARGALRGVQSVHEPRRGVRAGGRHDMAPAGAGCTRARRARR